MVGIHGRIGRIGRLSRKIEEILDQNQKKLQKNGLFLWNQQSQQNGPKQNKY